MKSVKVEATTRERREAKDPDWAANYNFPETVDEAAEMFGEDVVIARFNSAITVDLQGYLRSQNEEKEGKKIPSAAELQKLVDAWTPGLRPARKTKVEKTAAMYADMSADDRAELLKMIKGSPAPSSGMSDEGPAAQQAQKKKAA